MERLFAVYCGIALIKMGYDLIDWQFFASRADKYNAERAIDKSTQGMVNWAVASVIADLLWPWLLYLWIKGVIREGR